MTAGHSIGHMIGVALVETFPGLIDMVTEPAMKAFEDKLVYEAKGLRSEQGENPEYDRALVELTMRTLNRTEDDREEFIYRILKTKT